MKKKKSTWTLKAAVFLAVGISISGCNNPDTDTSVTSQPPALQEESQEENQVADQEKDWEEKMQADFNFNEVGGDGFFTNDLGITDIGDPFVLKAADGYYYMYCTSAPNGFYSWKSEDMIHWTDKKMCYVRDFEGWCIDCFWAPEVVEYEGKYYMYYTAKNQNDSLRIGLAVADEPQGPFLDVKNEPLFDFGYAVIDANVLIDEDGSKYLYYSRDCSENIQGALKKSEIYGVKLSDDMMSVEGEAVLLLTPEQPWELATGNTIWNEGPEMIKHNGTYYMSYSANFYASSTYSLGYATSDEPLGTFVKAEENPILTSLGRNDISGPGHHSFTWSSDGKELWAAYHSHTNIKAPSGNRKVNIDRVIFTEDGKMCILGPNTTIQPTPSGLTISNVTEQFSITEGSLNPQVNEGEARIVLQAEKKEELSSIAVYTGRKMFEGVKSLQLCMNGESYSEVYEIKEDEVSPIILSFDPIKADKIELIFKTDETQDAVMLTEITVYMEK